MSAIQHLGLPLLWEQTLRRHAPAEADAFLQDARRYLASDAPHRVPAGREAETLKNLAFWHLNPAQRDAVLYDLAAASLLQSATQPIATGLLAFGGIAAAAGVVLTRMRR